VEEDSSYLTCSRIGKPTGDQVARVTSPPPHTHTHPSNSTRNIPLHGKRCRWRWGRRERSSREKWWNRRWKERGAREQARREVGDEEEWADGVMRRWLLEGVRGRERERNRPGREDGSGLAGWPAPRAGGVLARQTGRGKRPAGGRCA
jgi:hypothetical protein